MQRYVIKAEKCKPEELGDFYDSKEVDAEIERLTKRGDILDDMIHECGQRPLTRKC